MMRIAVFASGGGSNLQALIDYFADERAHNAGRIALVASNRASSGALERARDADIATHHISDPTNGPDLLARLESEEVELIVLAGYLKLVPPEVVRAFHGRMINVHPALLPAFGGHGMYGQRVHEAVIASGALITGVTIHFVSEIYDQGPIIAQWPVAVTPDDDAKSLAARVLEVEHKLLPAAVSAVSSRLLTLAPDGRVHALSTSGPPNFTLNNNVVIDYAAAASPSQGVTSALANSFGSLLSPLIARLL